jgi:(p)ppGpp synthase/HD superfamily hydrolase
LKYTKDNLLTLSQRFEDALAYATVVHAGQLRKGTGIPYIEHILGVTGIALEHGSKRGRFLTFYTSARAMLASSRLKEFESG